MPLRWWKKMKGKYQPTLLQYINTPLVSKPYRLNLHHSISHHYHLINHRIGSPSIAISLPTITISSSAIAVSSSTIAIGSPTITIGSSAIADPAIPNSTTKFNFSTFLINIFGINIYEFVPEQHEEAASKSPLASDDLKAKLKDIDKWLNVSIDFLVSNTGSIRDRNLAIED
uniref:Uncharacterized protein n=1 Tax=Leersia perrieri TaxID=77586 RepID=A0A0D9XS07_9ORYZ